VLAGEAVDVGLLLTIHHDVGTFVPEYVRRNRNCMKSASTQRKLHGEKYICSGWEYVGEMEHVVLFMDTHQAHTPAVED
jgi:hypothetical protein